MKARMMDYPLTLTCILERTRRLYPRKEIASRMPSGMHRYTYGELYGRARRLARALKDLGVQKGDRVASFAWNHYRHLELYFAVPCMGAVLHTLNIRLFPEQIAYIINHAEDKFIVIDESLVPILEKIQSQLKSVQGYIVMADGGRTPETTLSPVYDYEELIQRASEGFEFPELEEDDAAVMCYTSGTTGNPKGALYSHRALVLHTLVECLPGALDLEERDVVMPVVPMFHVNAWGMPYAATLVGAKQVFPGPHLHPRDLAELIQQERVTVTAGVPTIWIGLYELLQSERYDLSSLKTIIIGGSAAPRSLIEAFEKEFGVPITHAWGMTEMSPLGTVSRLKSHLEELPEEERFDIRAKQGIPAPFVEIRAVDEQGREVPWDGKTMGELQVRGPWIIRSYYNDPRSEEAFDRGWFRTGDVVTIDPEGYIQIVDRTKDLVKSGGEWISSVELENAIMAHPKVLEAAVIAIPHPKWQERPLAVVVPKDEFKDSITKKEILEFLSGKFAKWWLPDDVVFVDRLPKTSVGKFDKKVLRKQFESYTWPPREEGAGD